MTIDELLAAAKPLVEAARKHEAGLAAAGLPDRRRGRAADHRQPRQSVGSRRQHGPHRAKTIADGCLTMPIVPACRRCAAIIEKPTQMRKARCGNVTSAAKIRAF